MNAQLAEKFYIWISGVSETDGDVQQKNLSDKYGVDSLLPHDSHVTRRLNQTLSSTSSNAHFKQMSIRSHYNPQLLSFYIYLHSHVM
jgi:hypothetical protein